MTHRARPPLRSRAWFDNPASPDLTALYLEKYLNYGLSLEELQGDRPIIGIAQTGSDLAPPPSAGASVVPSELNACARFNRLEAVSGLPSTTT